MPSEERNKALDELQDAAEQSDNYGTLVSEILDDLRERFGGLAGLLKSTTGWPRVWLTKGVTNESEFLQSVRFFSDIDRAHWGKLLTPLVNGIRVAGPFAPSWVEDIDQPHFVLIDTEGLGHKANTVPDVPDYIVSRFDECDAILLVHKGDVPFGYEGGKARTVLRPLEECPQPLTNVYVWEPVDSLCLRSNGYVPVILRSIARCVPLYGIEHAHGYLLLNANSLKTMAPAMARINIRILHNFTHEGVDLIPRCLHRPANAKISSFRVNE